jgi:Tfp pilus assembly protein FimV
MNAKAMHITQRRGHSLKACLLWLWLCLLGMPSHALTLGDLAVSSSAAPSFSASFPFSDDRPVRLAEMQARVATRGEYARWGYPVPSVLRELRVRVVPASETVGYVELY